ncbi:MAG: hypothetical protein ACRES7_10990 [Gammaproteobacteria bacterium]
MNPSDMNDSMTKIATSLSDMLSQSIQTGMNLLESLNKSGVSMLTQVAAPGGAAGIAKVSGTNCGCTIPTPCWMPQPLGELTALVCPGGTSTLRIRFTNCSMQETTVSVTADSPDVQFTIEPASLALAPLQRGVVTVSAKIPGDAANGQEFESLIRVRGCREYYLRYTLKAATKGSDCCHEIDVDDCPDYVHHWYDHFYCPRPCMHQTRGR